MAISRSPTQKYDELKRAALQARLPFEREAWLNLAFYLNQQYVYWNEKSNSIQRIPREKDGQNAPRPIVNKIMHFVQSERAMVQQAKPTVDVLPATDDMIDISHTAVANAYTKYLADPLRANFNRQQNRATLWAIIGGTSYLKWVWDPEAKQTRIIPCSIFEIAPDPYASDFNEARYVIHIKFMSLEEAEEKFPGHNLRAGREETVDTMKTELLRGMGSAPVISGVTVNELWYKPCKKYPDGMYVAWTGNQILREQESLPYDHKKIPFTFVGCIERPDSQWYMSPIEYLRSAQMQLNQYHAQRITNRKNFANGKWWIPDELEMAVDPDDSPNQILRGAGGNGLEPKLIQPLAMAENGDGAMIEEQMMHIVGLHEVSQAQVPGRVEAAKAIEMLKESDADRQATMLDTISAGISIGFWQALMLGKQYESPETILQTYTREGMPEVKAWKAEAIKPGMRVMVTMGTGLARSRAARQDQLQRLWDAKIITDAEQMAELMEVPIPTFTAVKMLDLRLARNENLVMAEDQAVTPNSWDDHGVHLREHNNWRKTHEYLMATDDVKQKFEYHCQTHKTLQVDQLKEQAALMMLANPQPAPAGGQPPTPPSDGSTPQQ